ncbi:integrase (plasmid) [Vitreoscilla filiformis]|uniref:Integrase n=1 Tax=Vitreoscilla filiformis TaxID=63 RepID=A0A221KJN6_VITFI|nr:tyrosine-type recombinase/integrase [Vitreoscilla filiformis]ASM79216.1 integrase [Vitreoscilla filiformis]
MNTPSAPMPRLGRHHFAYLRAVAEGLAPQACALRYLGIEHGHQARTAHRRVVDHVRSLSRRRGDRAWRLIGLAIRLVEDAPRPTLEDFADERQLDGWSQAELQQLYAEAFPVDPKTERRRRLRTRQLALLRELEQVAAQTPDPTDRIDGWFEPALAERLMAAGLLLLGDLRQRIQGGGRWWRGVAAVGVTKAARIAQHLDTLLPGSLALAGPAVPEIVATPRLPLRTHADNAADWDALQMWVNARAGSEATARSYRREGARLLLWLAQERQGRHLADMVAGDCLAYMAFLEHLPPHWQTRQAPFRGPLSLASRRQAVVILSGWFAWLAAAGLGRGHNPWMLVNRRTGDDAQADLLDSRAFTPEAWAALLDHVQRQDPTPSQVRMLFILKFVEATGLRASELVDVRLRSLRQHRGRWVLQVHGKGARNRLVAVPGQAEQALHTYLAARGWARWADAPADAPLLASTTDPRASICYATLYQTMKRWVRQAIEASALPEAERAVALRASPHWLRHTCGTRALERRAPLEVVQRQLGHADPRTTMRYARTQLERLQNEMESVFGAQP